MDRNTLDTEQLDAALLALEDEISWDPSVMLDQAEWYERQARLLGDDMLVARARLSQANLLMRAGDVPGAAQRIWGVHQWAVEHGARQLTARTHLVWANIHRHLGDAAQCLEHAVLSVELLDDTATEHMQIWHRTKLADALSLNRSIEAARERFEQAEQLAVRFGRPDVLLSVFNNSAYAEHAAGNFERAEQITDRLQKHAAKHGLELDPILLDTIAIIEISNGRFAEAERTLLHSIEQHKAAKYDDADALPEILLSLARARRGLRAYDRALASLDSCRQLCVERELGEILVRVHQEQAELYAACGDFEKAFEAHKVFFTAFTSLQSHQREAQARTRQAMFETAEARQEAERFREQARRDPLTGLRNRRYSDEQLPVLIETDPDLTVAIVDLDHFKRINDQLSHDVGDQVLVQVAKLLETELAAISANGFVARMGGEEFLLVLPQCPVGAAALRIDGIRRAVSRYDWSGLTGGLPVTVSIGVAGLAEAGATGLVSDADRNLYAAKHGGRNRVVAGVPSPDRRAYRDHASAA